MIVPLGDTYYFCFTTRQFSTGAPFTLAGTPVVSVYEENNTTQITADVAVSVDHDGVTGLNEVSIIASSGNGYEVGKYYSVVITTGTVDSVSVVGEVVGHFRVGPAEDAGAGIPDVNVVTIEDSDATDQINAACDTALSDINLDHLMKTGDATLTNIVEDNTALAHLMASGADISDYNNATDSLEAFRDHVGDGTNLTEAGGDGDHLTEAGGDGDHLTEAGGDGDHLTEAGGDGDHLSAIPWNSDWDTEVQSEVQDAIEDNYLDHLLKVADDDSVTNNSVIAKMAASDGDWSGFSAATDSLEAIQDDITDVLADTNELQTDNVPGLIAALNDPTAADIADAVWDEAIAAHTGAGATGEALSTAYANSVAIVADTNELQTDNVPGLIAALNDPTAAAIADAVWDEAVADHAGAGSTGLALAGATAPTAAAVADAVWDELIADHAGAGSTGAALSGASAPTAAAVADAVWEETLADHSGTAGSTAEKLNAAAAAGDPWTTELPGTYTGLQAGALLDAIKDKTDLITTGSITVLSSTSLSGDDLECRNGDSWSIAMTDLGSIAGRSKLWFAIKRKARNEDDDALIFLEESAGLTRVDGSAYATAAHGTITVTDEDDGDLTIAVDEAATSLLRARGAATWAVKMLTAAGTVTTLATGDAELLESVIDATS